MTHVAVSRSAEILLSPLLRRECIKNTLRICRRRESARKGLTRLPAPNLPLCHWSNQLSDLPAPSSTGVPVLLLNQECLVSCQILHYFVLQEEKRQFHRRLICLPVITWDPPIKLQKSILSGYTHNRMLHTVT